MKISLTKAGKRFNRDWIFRNITCEFIAGNSYAITGPNGSGKSTLLQALGGALQISEGKVEYWITDNGYQLPVTGNRQLATELAFQHLSIAAPYLEVIEEMSATEFLEFHGQFKPFLPGLSIDKILELVSLSNAAGKQIRYFSSGMKQRVKLAQAIFSHVPCVLLDEPCTNLDEAGIALYHQLINDYCKDRLVIVSSNDQQEYGFCRERLNILDWK